MSTFGERLRILRQEKKLTQKELALHFKLAESAISMYERDQREPSFELVKNFADFFDVYIDYILGQSDKRNPSLANRLIDASKKVEQGSNVTEQASSSESVDPKVSKFFKDFENAPKEKQEEAIRFWEFIKGDIKDRKQGDKQGE